MPGFEGLICETFAEDEEVVFNGGTYGDAVAMRFVDFAGITHPVIGRFARPKMYRREDFLTSPAE